MELDHPSTPTITSFSSTSTMQSMVDSPTYRSDNLRKSKIYIDTLLSEEWPYQVTQLRDFLPNNNFRGIIRESQVASLTSFHDTDLIPPKARIADAAADATPVVVGCSIALSETLRLRSEIKPLLQQAFTKVWWMDFASQMFATLKKDGEIATSLNERWNKPVESLERLAKVGGAGPYDDPKPALAFGLPPTDRHGVLCESALKTLASELYSPAWVYDCDPLVVYPAIIYESQPSSGSFFVAENRAAGAAAKALLMQRDLALYADDCPTIAFSPVAIVFCSQGALWEVFIAIHQPEEASDSDSETSAVPSGVHLLRIWTGGMSNAWDMLQLQVIIQRSRVYLKHYYKSAIIILLEHVHAKSPSSATSWTVANGR